jgi:hypothetical protein
LNAPHAGGKSGKAGKMLHDQEKFTTNSEFSGIVCGENKTQRYVPAQHNRHKIWYYTICFVMAATSGSPRASSVLSGSMQIAM